MEDKITSIKCRISTLKKLRGIESFPRETYEEIILRLINAHKREEKTK